VQWRRWVACCARGPRWNRRAYSFVHSLGCGDEAASRKTSHPALQAVDAHRTCGLVAGSAAGSGYLRALVRSASFSTLRLRVRFACGRRKGISKDPNPSVRPSWRRLATQRRTEPSEFSIFGVERPRQVGHGRLGSRRTTIRRSASQKRSANPSIRCC